ARGLADGELGVFFCHCSIPSNFSIAWPGPFAGKPAPTGTVQLLKPVVNLWERVHPRKGQPRQHINEALQQAPAPASGCLQEKGDRGVDRGQFSACRDLV
ncbi:hypothetical protein ACF8Q9_18910, partial [Pseudomonas sp. TYF_15]|uniref:hypothetical protein n=1 Tax=Pseudomonas sp. TYF_15 TaxID=3367194 RepID=UPI003709ED2F